MGRPIAYSPEAASLILAELEQGKSLREICEEHPEWPAAPTVRRWISSDIDGFRDKYAQSKATWAEAYAEEIIAIADDSSQDVIETEDGRKIANSEFINRSRLRVDTRKWLMSKLLPKKYGERIQQEVTGANGGPLTVSWLPAEVNPKKK